MKIFKQQVKAGMGLKSLVFFFTIAVVCVIASVYVAGMLVSYGSHAFRALAWLPPGFSVWDSKLFLYSATCTLVVVAAGSIYKTTVLSKGGGSVAESLGGRLLCPDTTHPDERNLRRVIEETAATADLPVPKIYVLDDEDGINAFVAGNGPADAAIGVTRGCMTLLEPEELQGVIGHEFSHILNGDMRLNQRIMGLMFGIVSPSVVGRILICMRGGRGGYLLMLLGMGLMAIGSIGVFFARLIQVALGRQREFLADVSSVELSRDPAGISRALQKIGVFGSHVESAHAGEASHIFFGNGMGRPLIALLATHPSIFERINAIDPDRVELPMQMPLSSQSNEQFHIFTIRAGGITPHGVTSILKAQSMG